MVGAHVDQLGSIAALDVDTNDLTTVGGRDTLDVDVAATHLALRCVSPWAGV